LPYLCLWRPFAFVHLPVALRLPSSVFRLPSSVFRQKFPIRYKAQEAETCAPAATVFRPKGAATGHAPALTEARTHGRPRPAARARPSPRNLGALLCPPGQSGRFLMTKTYALRVTCPAARGIVAAIAGFLAERGC